MFQFYSYSLNVWCVYIHPVKKPDKMKNISLLNKSHSFNAHIADFCRSRFMSAGSVEILQHMANADETMDESLT